MRHTGNRFLFLLLLTAFAATVTACDSRLPVNDNERVAAGYTGQFAYIESSNDLSVVIQDAAATSDGIVLIANLQDANYSYVGRKAYILDSECKIDDSFELTGSAAAATDYSCSNNTLLCLTGNELTLLDLDTLQPTTLSLESECTSVTGLADGFITASSATVWRYDSSGSPISSAKPANNEQVASEFESVFESDDSFFLVTRPNSPEFVYSYNKIDFDSGVVTPVCTSADCGIDGTDCFGEFAFTKDGEVVINPCTQTTTQLEKSAYTDLKPSEVSGSYKQLFAIDNNRYLRAFTSS